MKILEEMWRVAQMSAAVDISHRLQVEKVNALHLGRKIALAQELERLRQELFEQQIVELCRTGK